MPKVICPYCDRPARRVTGAQIYPGTGMYLNRVYYQCVPCKAYVGTHKATGEPLGSLANGHLRNMRMQAHNRFDPIWLSGRMRRPAAYAWLAEQLGISVDNCHIGMFDIETCQRTIDICKEYHRANSHRGFALRPELPHHRVDDHRGGDEEGSVGDRDDQSSPVADLDLPD